FLLPVVPGRDDVDPAGRGLALRSKGSGVARAAAILPHAGAIDDWRFRRHVYRQLVELPVRDGAVRNPGRQRDGASSDVEGAAGGVAVCLGSYSPDSLATQRPDYRPGSASARR